MRIDSSPRLGALHLTDTRLGPSLKVGQQLQATVAAFSRDHVVLDLAGHRLEARSELQLRPGQPLELRVVSVEPRVTLQVLKPAPQSQQAFKSAVLALLPRAGSLETATPHWAALAKASQEGVPPELRTLLAALTKRFPDSTALQQPATLREALQQSGLFRESGLAHAATQGHSPPTDLKTALERVAARLRASVGGTAEGAPAAKLLQLLSHSEAALSRLGLLQLNAAAPQGPLDLLFEFPVWHEGEVEPLRLRIQEDPDQAGAAEADNTPAFKVRLEFQFPELGPVQAHLQLQADSLAVSWVAQQPETVGRLRSHLDRLESKLRALGLEVDHMDAYQGRLLDLGDLPRLREGLLHEKA